MKNKLILAMLALALPCGAALAQSTDTLAKIRDKQEIALGVRETALPFSYLDGDNKVVGYSVDLCLRVVQGLKASLKLPQLNVKQVVVASSNRIPLIANGTVDLECGTTSNTLDRQKQVAFSVTTFVSGTRFVSKKSAQLTDLAALRDKPVVATAGSSNLRQINELNANRDYNMRISASRDFAEGFLMVETDRAAAFFLDDITLAGLIANAKDPSAFVISREPLSVEPYALMMRKDDRAFKAQVDTILKTIYANGEQKAIYRKWFEAPIPPKGINMNVPMGAALQRVVAKPIDSAEPSDY